MLEETTQQFIALALVGLALGFECLRKYRKQKAGKVGCENCSAQSSARKS